MHITTNTLISLQSFKIIHFCSLMTMGNIVSPSVNNLDALSLLTAAFKGLNARGRGNPPSRALEQEPGDRAATASEPARFR